MELGIKNRVHQLKGESFDKRLVFDMHYEKLWNEFYALNGLTTHLNNMVRLLLPVVPFKGLGITSVEFVLGKHTSFVSLKD